jgi:hypothetical protein
MQKIIQVLSILRQCWVAHFCFVLAIPASHITRQINPITVIPNIDSRTSVSDGCQKRLSMFCLLYF